MKKEKPFYRRVMRVGICFVLLCSLGFMSGCSDSEDTSQTDAGISDLLPGKKEEGGRPGKQFSILGSEYAEKEDPLEALLEAEAAHLEDVGFADVTITDQTSDTYIPDEEEGSTVQLLQGQLTMTSPEGEAVDLTLSFQWNLDTEQLIHLFWASFSGGSFSADHILSEDVLLGSEELLSAFDIQDEEKYLYFHENKVLRLMESSGWGELMVMDNAVKEEKGFYYIEKEGGAYIFDAEALPEIYPDSLGGLPVTEIQLVYGSGSFCDYLGLPGTVRRVTGVSNVPITIFPKSVEEISAMTFAFPNLTGTFFVFNPEVKLTQLYLLEVYEKAGNSPCITIYCQSEEAFQELTDRFPGITVRSIDDYRGELSEEEVDILDAAAEGDYTDIDEIFRGKNTIGERE